MRGRGFRKTVTPVQVPESCKACPRPCHNGSAGPGSSISMCHYMWFEVRFEVNHLCNIGGPLLFDKVIDILMLIRDKDYEAVFFGCEHGAHRAPKVPRYIIVLYRCCRTHLTPSWRLRVGATPPWRYVSVATPLRRRIRGDKFLCLRPRGDALLSTSVRRKFSVDPGNPSFEILVYIPWAASNLSR